jgi:hypothetical protein
MPFALDSNPSNIELSDAINYLLGNFGANLSADPNTGLITGPTGQTIAYLYKYLSVRYADSADGSLNFSNSPTNRQYYGIRNNNSNVESTNPADYIWRRVAGGFSTTKFLFYKVTGGRQIEFFVDTIAPGYAWVQDSGAAIDLDAISVVITATPTIYIWTATSTPPARPATSTTYTWLTGTYTAPALWSVEVPSNTTPGAYLWEIAITIVQTGGINTETLDWPNVIYPIRAVGRNGDTGQTGNSAITAYRAQDQALAAPTFTTPTSGPNAPAGWTLGTPSVSVGQVLWYIQGEYNSSATLTINGVAPNTTRWTGPIAASVFQDIRSDNWNGSNPPTFGSPGTWGTAGYYISRSTGTAILNNLGARGTIQSGSSPAISGSTMTGAGAVINSSGTFAVGDSSNNITYNGSTINLNGNIVAAGNLKEGTTTTQSGNTFGFGNGTSVFGISTAGFFKSTNSGTAGLAGIATNSVGLAGNTASTSSYGALFSNTYGYDSISATYVVTALSVAGPNFGLFTQRRSSQSGSASESGPGTNTAAYATLGYLSGSDHYGGRMFTTNTSGVDVRGIMAGGPTYGLTVTGGTAPFTGCHDGLLLKDTTVVAGDIIIDTGVIVATSGVTDTITEVAVSATANQKGVLGIFATISTQIPNILQIPVIVPVWQDNEWVDTVEYELNPIYQPIVDTHDYVAINSVGEGQMNVCGENGDFQVGDLIVCSSTPGKGMKQSDDLVRNTTVAKIRENVAFASPTEVKLVSCIYMCG